MFDECRTVYDLNGKRHEMIVIDAIILSVLKNNAVTQNFHNLEWQNLFAFNK